MNNLGKTLLIASAIALAPTTVVAQGNDIGKREYEANCAVCHGSSGKGNGPMAGIITQKVPDLTVLAKNNGGVFPFNQVYETIDGSRMVDSHGTRDMPIWGLEYSEKASDYYMDYPRPYSTEGFVRGRILALTGYIYSLQAK